MCNCGNKRQQYNSSLDNAHYISRLNKNFENRQVQENYFQYTGLSALTVTGNVTGKRYRFQQQGSSLEIDYRDVPGMMMVPVLKKVKVIS